MKVRTRMSSWRRVAYSRPAYHLESQPSMTPRRNPFGCTFWPITSLPCSCRSRLLLLALADDDRDVARSLHHTRRSSMRAGKEAFLHPRRVDVRRLHVQGVDVNVLRRLGVGDCRFERLRDHLRRAARVELEDTDCLLDSLAANQIEHEPCFLGRDPKVACARARLHQTNS